MGEPPGDPASGTQGKGKPDKWCPQEGGPTGGNPACSKDPAPASPNGRLTRWQHPR